MDRPDFPGIIFTDDAWILNSDPPITQADLRDKVVAAYAGTGGALWWSTGDHEVYHFETRIGEIFGAEQPTLEGLDDLYSFVHSAGDDDAYPKVAANVRALIEECGGPLTALLRLCRERGLPFFPRVRMNSHYVIDPRHPGYGNYRRRHPDRLIARPGERFAEGTIEHGIGTGLDYAHPGNRAFVTRIIRECFERFDVDGVELDFMRHPAFFRVEEGYANRHYMTGLVREVRARMQAVSADRGRRLLLGVRVPPSIADCNRVGLDVVRWLEEGLVDIVVVGGGFISFETPVDEFVAAAAGTGALVYGCIEATRDSDDRKLRALALRWLEDGAHGVYLYNFFTRSPGWNRRIASELTDREKLRRLDKRYELETTGSAYGSSGHSSAFALAQSQTQLPVRLQPNYDGEGPVLRLAIADDFDAAREAGELGPCRLTLRFDALEESDSLRVRVNGRELDWSGAEVSFDGWEELTAASLFWLSYPAEPVEQHMEGSSASYAVTAPPLRQGEIEIEIRLLSETRAPECHVSLVGLEIDLTLGRRER